MPKPMEQREPTRSLEDRTKDVMKALRDLHWMKGFPEDVRAQLMISKAIAKFCQTVESFHGNEKYPNPTEDLGWVNPLEWLTGEVAANHEFFPPPIIWRRIYDAKFETLDHRSAESIRQISEG